MIDPVNLVADVKLVPCCRFVGIRLGLRAPRVRMKLSAATSDSNTPGSVLPSGPRSRITTTTLRLPERFYRRRRSRRLSRRLAGFT